MKNQEAKYLYRDVINSVSNSLERIKTIKLKKTEDAEQVNNIIDELDRISSNFSEELTHLEEYSEWEKFTIAFFGETNAGKSTIIESLRIALNETQREEVIHKNTEEYKQVVDDYYRSIDDFISQLDVLYYEHGNSLNRIEKSVGVLQERQNKLFAPKRIAVIYTSLLVIGVLAGYGLSFI
jgi:predicted AlkP superfamily phosphohydrolase/phosphomutase